MSNTNQMGLTRKESGDIYDAVTAAIEQAEGAVTGEQILQLAGQEMPEDGFERMGAASYIQQVITGVKTRLGKHPDPKQRGGLRSGATKENPGEYEILRGDEYVRDQVVHRITKMQREVSALANWAAMMNESDMKTIDGKTKSLISLLVSLSKSTASVQIGVLDPGIKSLRRRHPDFKDLELLQDQLEDFIDDTFDDE